MSATADATRVATQALSAFGERAWETLVELYDEDGLARFQHQQLAMIVTFMQLTDVAREKRGMHGMGVNVGGTIDPALIDARATTPVRGFPGAPTVGALAALEPRRFAARWFAFNYPRENDAPLPHVLTSTVQGEDRVDVECTAGEPDATPWSGFDRRTVISLRRSRSGDWRIEASEEPTMGTGAMLQIIQDYRDGMQPPP